MEDNLELGGNIVLVGFKETDPAEMIVIKKVVGNYSRKISEKNKDFKKLIVTLKGLHGNRRFEVTAKLDADKLYSSEVTEYNLFFAVDSSLKKILNSLS